MQGVEPEPTWRHEEEIVEGVGCANCREDRRIANEEQEKLLSKKGVESADAIDPCMAARNEPARMWRASPPFDCKSQSASRQRSSSDQELEPVGSV
jgi:hypothetical protein